MINFQKIEDKWQKRWEEKKVFNAQVDKKKDKFFFTTPYPYISGSLHIGHGRAVIESDIYTRFKRMQGFNVLYPMAFHITGTPVLGISSAIKNGDKNVISLYEEYVSAYEKNSVKINSIVKSFENPEKIVEFFIPKMISEYGQLGLGIDWTRSFTSGDTEHKQLVSWQFEKYNELGFLKKGKYAVLYSPEDESAMGEDDITEADSNPVEKQEFTLLKFKLNEKFLVAATLRPETIYGQTNLWINPDAEYVEAKVGKEIWILSREAFEKLSYQKEKLEFLGKTKEKLIGEYVLAQGINKKIIILPAEFVDSDFGTGIVTCVPSDAPYDYTALKEIQENSSIAKKYKLNSAELKKIEIIPIIETKKYGNLAAVKLCEERKVSFKDEQLLEKLTQEVYKEGFHSGKMLENCGEYSGMLVGNAKEKIKTDLLKNGSADIMFETSRKAFSRGGGKIIVAVLDGQWFIDFNAKGWKEKATKCLEKIKIIPENYRQQFKDTFEWLDKRPCARKRGLGTQFPLDKSWIIESLSDSTIYMTLYTINHLIRKNNLKEENLTSEFFDFVMLGKGELKKVSSSTKIKEPIIKEIRESFEYWMPQNHRHTFSLHLSNHLSFMIFAFAGIFPEKYWPEKITFHGLVLSEGTKMSKSKGNTITLLKVKEKYGADVLRFYMTSSSNIEGVFDWRETEAENSKATLEKLYNEISDAIKKKKKGNVRELYISKFEKIKKTAFEKINEMKLREYSTSAIFDMLRVLKNAKLVMEEKELSAFYALIVEDWIKMISPVAPHIAEELWEKSGKKNFVSLESFPKADESKINDELEKIEETTDKTVSDILNILKIIKEKQGEDAEKIYLYVLPNELQNYNSKELSVRTNKKVEIFSVNDKKKYDPQGKSSKAKFGKPAIYVE